MSRTYLLGLALALFLSSQAPAEQTGPQPDTDRRSEADYKLVPMHQRPNPQLCLHACLHEAKCHSWTLVKNPHGGATCHLGKQLEQPKRNACCTSGTR
jgi:hypothetical protein